MYDFFNLTEHHEVQIPMYGLTHLLTVIGMFILLFLVIWQRKRIKKVVNNHRLFRRIIFVYLSIELLFWILIWAYRIEPMYERFPLHLCGTLSILMPVLILMRKRNLARFFSYWATCAGFIAYVNPGFVFAEANSFNFVHYLIRHYFVFLIPFVLHFSWDFKHSYREFIRSTGALAAWAFVIFLLDWATGANFMHLGPNNPLEIPFLPASFTAWPYSYPSFVMVGIILFHLAFLAFKQLERKRA